MFLSIDPKNLKSCDFSDLRIKIIFIYSIIRAWGLSLETLIHHIKCEKGVFQ